MAIAPNTAGSIAADTRSIDALKFAAGRDPKAAIKETAKQFEALFMQQLMKSMREATMSSGMLDNEGSKLGTELLDTQFATKMTGMPGGLADAIARQLERQMGIPASTPAAPAAPAATAAPAAAGGTPDAKATTMKLSSAQSMFVAGHTASAKAAEAASGIPAAFMVAQAAHESGWGRREIRNADGTSAHNLFGIKAGAGWNGPVAEVTTTEYVAGQAHKVTAKFRAYGSYAESFQDYAKMMKTSPRYAEVVANASTAQGFAQGLQKAGYATDPAYAEKLTRVINTTLRMQRAVT
jgi:peptidoglycan hydrolase FlgJ